MRAVLVLALLAASPAWSATLRGGTALSDPAVRLSDLFDGVEHDRSIGPGPEPGGRIIVEAAQLGAIARQFGVDWRPASSADRIVLERPGRPFPREDAMAALRRALAVAGVPRDADIDMPGFSAPMIPAEAGGQGEVGQLDYEGAQAGGSGRFTAVLSVTAPGMAPAHARLSGQVIEMVELPVAAHRMMPGDVIGPGDLQPGRLRASAVRSEVAQVPAQAVGMAMRHPIGAGAPLPLADLVRPTAVQKGDVVQMQLDLPGISVVAQGTAMDSGARGDRIRVLNPASRALVDAEVVSSGTVRVSGTVPALLPPGAPVPVRVAGR